jgi:TfoX/Sxy family transcriptional regulator of competence genes
MAYDEGLAERIRTALAGEDGVVEKKMFGGLAFMVRGHMSVGIVKDDLMVRASPKDCEQWVREPHARPMDFTGRPMSGFLYVDADGYESDADLERWVGRALAFALAQAGKKASAAPRVPKRSRKR